MIADVERGGGAGLSVHGEVRRIVRDLGFDAARAAAAFVGERHGAGCRGRADGLVVELDLMGPRYELRAEPDTQHQPRPGH